MFANEQFAVMKSKFVERGAGVFAGLREYPPGTWALGDVDSGPVVLGISASGTGFAVGGARWMRDAWLISALMFTAEFVGSTVALRGQRHYLLAPLVGESIMLAMLTTCPWDDRFVTEGARSPTSSGSTPSSPD